MSLEVTNDGCQNTLRRERATRLGIPCTLFMNCFLGSVVVETNHYLYRVYQYYEICQELRLGKVGVGH